LRLKQLAVFAVLTGSGCSIFFDPGKAPRIPCTPEACPVRAGATARCDDEVCVYNCTTGAADTNEDLNDGGTDGCEDVCPPPEAPVELHALVGNPSGAVQWIWDRVDGGNERYRLCTGPQETMVTNCRTFSGDSVCSKPKGGMACSASTTDLMNNVRHYGRVQTIDRCRVTSPEDKGAVQSVTPFNGEFANTSDLILESTCAAQPSTDAGVLKLAQTSLLCLTALHFGDDVWQDFTMRADVRLRDIGNAVYPGFAFHYPSGTLRERREILLTGALTASEANASVVAYSPATGNEDKVSASSIGPVDGLWKTIEIVAQGPLVAVGLGPAGSPSIPPILRWRESVSNSTRGRFGLFMYTISLVEESVEFRNVTISTRAVVPDAGSASRKIDLSQNGLPPGVRVTPSGSTNVKVGGCPTSPQAAPDCAVPANCLPNAGSNCIEVNQLLNSRHALSFDQPVGLDPTKPWRLSFKFNSTGMGSNGQILRSLSGKGLGGRSVIKAPAAAGGKIAVFGVDTNVNLVSDTWNRFDLKVNNTNFSVDINGNPVTSGFFPPPNFDQHLGAFIFGGQGVDNGAIRGYWTDIEVAQPP
jgi:hypothetical protein